MTKQESLYFVNRKMKQRLPINKHDEEFEEIKNIDGQVDMEEL